MYKNIVAIFILFLWCSLQGFHVFGQKKRPNIIVFLVDDMGWQDTSVPFWAEKTKANNTYHTPFMERLAAEGMKFTDAYATPVCSPSRISLITGMNVTRHGVTNWTSPYANTPTDQEDSQFLAPQWNYNGISNTDKPHTVQATTFPQLLSNVGYLTILAGKAHFGPSGMPGSNPYNLGFMVNIAGHAGGRPKSYRGENNYGNLQKNTDIHAVPDMEEYYGSETFLSEALTKEAIKSMLTPIKTKQPFFLLMSHYAIHDPFDEDKRFVQKYLDAGLPPVEASYAALIEGMDKSLGDIMDFLKEKKVDNNTIIIFMSDNGGLSAYGRSGRKHQHNLPLRSGKGSVYEGGVRVPMIVKWPAVTMANSITSQPVIIEDFFPTILQMAGVDKYNTMQKIDGRSFVNVLKNANTKLPEKAQVWHSPNKWQQNDGPGINFHSALRLGNWKIVHSYRNGDTELYDLKSDIGEQNNLATSYPQIKNKLLHMLGSILQQNNAPMPIDVLTGKSVAYPFPLNK